MNDISRIFTGAVVWIGAISGLHAAFNVDWTSLMNERLPEDQRKLNIAYIPVT